MRRFVLLVVMITLMGCSSETRKPPEGSPAVEPPKVSEEAAVKAASSADPQSQVEGWAGWQVHYEKAIEVELNGKKEQRAAWVVEAVHLDGEKNVFYVSGDEYPPKMLRIDKMPGMYVSRDTAMQAALRGTKNVGVSGVRFSEKHRFEDPSQGTQELAVWIVELVSTSDQRPAGQMIVDATAGRVLSASNAPSGQ